jgi:CubicO group peptidase (beta-lactamase class C family)
MAENRNLSRRALLASGTVMLLTSCAKRVPVVATSPQGGAAQQNRGTGGIDAALADLPRWMRLSSVPGVGVAVVRNGETTVRGYGVTRAGGTNAVSADTTFEAASLSKPVFAYLVLRLAADGAIDLDKPLGDYLTNPGADSRAAKITASHLMSHSSGWRNWRTAPTHTLTSDWEPGSRFSYSGEGFYYLQRVVEKITGKGLIRLTRERIFEPLGMRRSSFLWSPELDVNRAEPHSNRGVAGDSFGARTARAFRDIAAAAGKSMDDWTHEDAERASPKVNKDNPVFPNWLLPNAAASMLTSANDYGLFLRHLLSPEGKAVLDRMQSPQVTINESLGWGLGFGRQTGESGQVSVWHWGDNFGFKNFVLLTPATRSATLVFTNGQSGRAVYERVIRAVNGGDQPAFLWI